MTKPKIAVLGATGKIGFAAASVLREVGVPVRAIIRDAAKESPLRVLGCEVGFADLQDPDSISAEIADCDAVQILLPPPPRAADAEAEMRRVIENLAEALDEAKPNRVVAISDYGAHIGEGVGMPYMFYLYEERLRQLDTDVTFLRSAEHIEGWAPFIPGAIATGVLPSFHHPVDAEFPTVSAPDVGTIAADLLRGAISSTAEVIHVEGPRRYSANDVAASLSRLTDGTITAEELPRSEWARVLNQSLSESSAQLVIGVYEAHNTGGLIDVEPGARDVRRGATNLTDALQRLVLAVTDNTL